MKQIVGGTLANGAENLRTNFVSLKPAAWYAELYRRDRLAGGHVIMLGPGNEAEARSALRAYPGGLQIGGGINLDNAPGWLAEGASHVILTSWLFHGGKLERDRLKALSKCVGKDRLVLDLSCRRRGDEYWVVTDRWRTFSETKVDPQTLQELAGFCAEFLVHAVDVEGLCEGIDQELVAALAEHAPIPVTYAGGAKSLDDLETVARLGRGRVALTIGSALDIFGGAGVRYADAVAFNRRHSLEMSGQ